MDLMDQNEPKSTKIDQMDQSRPNEPKWFEMN